MGRLVSEKLTYELHQTIWPLRLDKKINFNSFSFQIFILIFFENSYLCPTFSYQTFGSSTLCWWVIFFAPYRSWNVTPSTNVENLNTCHDSCAKITKVKICVAWFVHLHLCLLDHLCMLACWLSCHMLLGGKGITKVYVILTTNLGSTCSKVDLLIFCV